MTRTVSLILLTLLVVTQLHLVTAFQSTILVSRQSSSSTSPRIQPHACFGLSTRTTIAAVSPRNCNDGQDGNKFVTTPSLPSFLSDDFKKTLATTSLAFALVVSNLFSLPLSATAAFEKGTPTTPEATLTSSVTSTAKAATTKTYDGFAEYAKENQMEQSDVGCFINKCGPQTRALFSNPRGIKGISCLGRCKGEQSCATRCFAEFGSETLNDWLSCTIEENECVKVPKNIDNSAENVGFANVVQKFDAKSLIGTWYKTDGLNPNYDLFDCQTNTFTAADKDATQLNMGIFFRVQRPPEAGGGFWENSLVEQMVVDNNNNNNNINDNSNNNNGYDPESGINTASSDGSSERVAQVDVSLPDTTNNNNDGGFKEQQTAPADTSANRRTMHTSGKMYGLEFRENWYIIGESDGSNDIPPFKLVAYKGHTLQGNYEGAFVYAKEPVLPEAARPAVREAAARAGLDFDAFTRIDNTCPASEPLNDSLAGTGTSTTDWINLVIGEGGVVDWIFPGWRQGMIIKN